jgi:hypothetical protein
VFRCRGLITTVWFPSWSWTYVVNETRRVEETASGVETDKTSPIRKVSGGKQ